MGKPQNLTVRLDEDVIRQAKVLAAHRGTSISQLVADKIAEAVNDARSYAEARRGALSLLEQSFHLGPPKRVSRDDIHARR